MTQPLVEVLLSTYMGERHLAQQVASILEQSHRQVRLVIRDDGSTDGTVGIAESFRDERVEVRRGSNVGLPQAYFRLLDESGGDADYWALADQDDVWLPDKMERAVAALAAIAGPALYCARVLVTDAQLRPLYPHALPTRGPSFANALVQNIALGCTTVLNAQAREVLRERWPNDCVMHDAWMYLVVAGCGTVVYDDRVALMYRQHSGNSVGMGRSRLTRVAGQVRRQLSPDGPRKHSRQDRELARTHWDDLLPPNRELLSEFLAAQGGLRRRTAYALTGAAHRQSRGSDLVLKVLQVAGRV